MNTSDSTDVANHRGVSHRGLGARPLGWRQVVLDRLQRMGRAITREFNILVELLRIPPPLTSQVLQRIEIMEQHIILPIKAGWIAILLRPSYFSSWVGEAAKTLTVTPQSAYWFFWIYVALNVLAGTLILLLRRIPPALTEGTVFVVTLVDSIFLGVLTVVTGGYDSPLYWLFLGLIVRTAVNVPRATSQLLLNLTLSTCFVLAGFIDSYVAQNLDPTERRVLELYADNPGEPLLLRLVLLLLMTLFCYAIQVLLERQRRAMEEAREFAMREGQLRSAGRLAAEFAHQIKNPLAIINTAAFSLQKAIRENKADAFEQVEMIQEEVERADRIITQVMGYSQLSEGHVEKLNVLEELDLAIERVFPRAAHFPFQVHRSYQGNFPPLLMLRRHVSETFMNVLQNAREALEVKGSHIFVDARCPDDQSIEVSIGDDGPGISPDKIGRIFEPYYTTKEKGSGLGLATVKHNLELYGGQVKVESELGKGVRFILLFPAKTLMKTAQTNA